MKTKLCTKCGNVYPFTVEYFYPRTRENKRFLTYCRYCRNADAKKRYYAKRDYILKYNRSYMELNRDKLNEKASEMYHKNLNLKRKTLARTALSSFLRGLNGPTSALLDHLCQTTEDLLEIKRMYDIKRAQYPNEIIHAHHKIPLANFDLTNPEQRKIAYKPSNTIFLTQQEHANAHYAMTRGYQPLYNMHFVPNPEYDNTNYSNLTIKFDIY